MLIFPTGYFEDGEREGTAVSADMKCAWAAQLEVLKAVEGICDKYGLKYFAYYGTLLGAVRHNGFIPWDDDIDIAMLREDYDKLLDVALSELPDGYVVRNMHVMEESESYISRISNSGCINANQGFIMKNYGCPYAAGVDIFPLDYVPSDENTRKAKDEILELVLSLAEISTDNPKKNKKNKALMDGIDAVEGQFDFKFDRNGNLCNQLFCLYDFLSCAYADAGNTAIVTNYWNYLVHNKSYIFHKLWLSEMIDVGFEVSTVRAPIGLEAVLSICYGNSFMVPRKFSAHGSPFDEQKEQLIKGGLYDKVLEARKLITPVVCVDGVRLAEEEPAPKVPDEILNELVKNDGCEGTGRKVILYALNSASIVRYGKSVIHKIEHAIKVFEESKSAVCVILAEDMTFLATLNDMYPEIFDKYVDLRQYIVDNGIGALSDSLYYDYASLCNAYYGDGTSVMGSFMKAGKPIMLQNYNII